MLVITQKTLLPVRRDGQIINSGTTTVGVGEIHGISMNNPLFTGVIGLNQSNPGALFHIGSGTRGNDQNAGILLSFEQTVGNGHGFSDYTTYISGGGTAYASFDARVATSGSNNYNHLIAFQAAIEHASSGTLDIMYAGGASIPYNNGGLITDLFGWRSNDLQGTGSATNVYGFYCEELTKGTNKYAFYSKGATQSLFEGTVKFGNGTQGTQLIYLQNTLGILYVGGMTTGSWAGVSNRLGIVNGASYPMVISNNDNQPIIFGTSDIERIRILGGGNTGFGFSSPSAKVAINGGLHIGGESDPGDNNLHVDGDITGGSYKTTNFTIIQSGTNLLIKYGTTTILSLSSAGYLAVVDDIEPFASL